MSRSITSLSRPIPVLHPGLTTTIIRDFVMLWTLSISPVSLYNLGKSTEANPALLFPCGIPTARFSCAHAGPCSTSPRVVRKSLATLGEIKVLSKLAKHMIKPGYIVWLLFSRLVTSWWGCLTRCHGGWSAAVSKGRSSLEHHPEVPRHQELWRQGPARHSSAHFLQHAISCTSPDQNRDFKFREKLCWPWTSELPLQGLWEFFAPGMLWWLSLGLWHGRFPSFLNLTCIT